VTHPEIHTVRTGPNHALHAVLTLLTCGLWGFVWIVIAITNPRRAPVVTEAPHVTAILSTGTHAWPTPGNYITHYSNRTSAPGHWNGTRWIR
jgi:hypothetical protein